jgi:hypothetical protein
MGVKQGSESYKVYTEEVGHPAEQGTRGGKSNHETATLRAGNLPKSEAVRTVSLDENKGAAVACAKKQNTMHDSHGEAGLAVLPNTGTLKPPVSSAK